MAEVSFRDNQKINEDGTRCDPVKVKETVGSNRITVYTTVLWSDNVRTCNCPSWAFKKPGKARTCKHIKLSEDVHDNDMTVVAAFKSQATTIRPNAQFNPAAVNTRGNRAIHVVRDTEGDDD
jgi:hypothetical protein